MDQTTREQAKEAFADFVCKNESLFYFIARRLLDHKEDQEDCIANVTLRVLSNIETFASLSEARKRAYFSIAVHHESINILSKRKKMESTLLPLDAECPDPFDLEASLLTAERNRVFHQCIQSLPAADRELFEKYYHENRSAKQIADETGLKPETVHTYLSRMRAKLKAMLAAKGFSL